MPIKLDSSKPWMVIGFDSGQRNVHHPDSTMFFYVWGITNELQSERDLCAKEICDYLNGGEYPKSLIGSIWTESPINTIPDGRIFVPSITTKQGRLITVIGPQYESEPGCGDWNMHESDRHLREEFLTLLKPNEDFVPEASNANKN